jgi:hypothetical protein
MHQQHTGAGRRCQGGCLVHQRLRSLYRVRVAGRQGLERIQQNQLHVGQFADFCNQIAPCLGRLVFLRLAVGFDDAEVSHVRQAQHVQSFRHDAIAKAPQAAVNLRLVILCRDIDGAAMRGHSGAKGVIGQSGPG